MASEAQIRANRANALRSTGPRTARGKARSALNGLKHGLRSHLPLPETPELQRYRAEFLDEWRPSTPEACMLVERLAVAIWRFYYVDRLLELAMRHPDPRVVGCRAFTLSRHYAAASNMFLKTAGRLYELPTGTDHHCWDLHDQTQSPNKINNRVTQLRPKCRVFFPAPALRSAPERGQSAAPSPETAFPRAPLPRWAPSRPLKSFENAPVT